MKKIIITAETNWVEFNELVFNRENPKLIYKNKLAINKKLIHT